jgi:hypothetical protein
MRPMIRLWTRGRRSASAGRPGAAAAAEKPPTLTATATKGTRRRPCGAHVASWSPDAPCGVLASRRRGPSRPAERTTRGGTRRGGGRGHCTWCVASPGGHCMWAHAGSPVRHDSCPRRGWEGGGGGRQRRVTERVSPGASARGLRDGGPGCWQAGRWPRRITGPEARAPTHHLRACTCPTAHAATLRSHAISLTSPLHAEGRWGTHERGRRVRLRRGELQGARRHRRRSLSPPSPRRKRDQRHILSAPTINRSRWRRSGGS